MSPAIFSTTAAWTKATQPYAASPPGPTIRRLRRKLRRVRLNTAQSYSDLHERARIYSALAARETKGSEHKLVLLRLTEEAGVRLERAEASLRKLRIAHSLPPDTCFRRLRRWLLLRWRISWTLALLDRIESRRSRATLQALTELSRLCRVIAAARMRPNQFFSRLSIYHSDDP